MLTVRTRASLIGLALLLGVSTTTWAQAPTLTFSVGAGNVLTLNWTAVPGATNYLVQAQVQAGGVTQHLLGDVTTISAPLPFGTYLARIVPVFGGAQGQPSNVVTIVVAPPPPAAPANLGAIVNGGGTLLSWDLPSTSGISSVFLQAGTSSGAADLGAIPVGVTKSLAIPSLPLGTYFVRMLSAGTGGVSAPSNEIALNVPGCDASGAIPLTLNSYFGYVSMSWPAVPGATGYQLLVSSTQGGVPNLAAMALPATTTRLTLPSVPLGNYYVTLNAQLSCGPSVTSGEELLTVDASAGSGPRTPDPAPGARLPLPSYGASVVQSIASQFPGELRNSCREHGGNNTFLFRVVQRLREQDSRWGLNWKRGNRGDMSQDVVTYHFGAGPDEDSTAVYIIDMIVGHCGPNPGAGWGDVTEATRRGGTIGRWTLRPLLEAGFVP